MKLRIGFVSNSSSSSFVLFPAVTEQKIPIKVLFPAVTEQKIPIKALFPAVTEQKIPIKALFTNDGKKIPEQQNGQEGTYKIKTFG